MDYELLETQIVNRLAFMRNANITVREMPELEIDRTRPFPTKAGITVIYAGSEYSLPNSTSQVKQDEKIFIQVLIESTFLRGPQGVYNLLSVIKDALIGYSPSWGTRLQMVKHHTIGGEDAQKINNMWAYNAIFQTTGISVENYTEDFISLLKKITLIDKPGDETNEIPNPNN